MTETYSHQIIAGLVISVNFYPTKLLIGKL